MMSPNHHNSERGCKECFKLRKSERTKISPAYLYQVKLESEYAIPCLDVYMKSFSACGNVITTFK